MCTAFFTELVLDSYAGFLDRVQYVSDSKKVCDKLLRANPFYISGTLLCLICSFFLYLYSPWAVGFCKKMFAQFYLSTLYTWMKRAFNVMAHDPTFRHRAYKYAR